MNFEQFRNYGAINNFLESLELLRKKFSRILEVLMLKLKDSYHSCELDSMIDKLENKGWVNS